MEEDTEQGQKPVDNRGLRHRTADDHGWKAGKNSKPQFLTHHCREHGKASKELARGSWVSRSFRLCRWGSWSRWMSCGCVNLEAEARRRSGPSRLRAAGRIWKQTRKQILTQNTLDLSNKKRWAHTLPHVHVPQTTCCHDRGCSLCDDEEEMSAAHIKNNSQNGLK